VYGGGDDVSDAHLAWTQAGVAVSGTFICLYEVGYVKTDAGEVGFSTPADLRRQLMGVAPRTAITITYLGQQDGRKMFQVTIR
jgi:hypothetical protein